jgi:hypothetical protein
LRPCLTAGSPFRGNSRYITNAPERAEKYIARYPDLPAQEFGCFLALRFVKCQLHTHLRALYEYCVIC